MAAIRLAARRLGAQRGVVAVAALVALVGCATLATMATLDVGVDRFAVPAALIRTPAADVQLRVHADLSGRPLRPVLDAVAATRADTFGGRPERTDLAVSSALRKVPEPGVFYSPMVYLGDYDGVRDHVRLLSGRWPAPAAGTVEVAVPRPVRGMTTSGTVRLRDVLTDTANPVRVVGVYEVTDPGRDFWWVDHLHGSSYAASWPVPGAPQMTAPLYGPLLTAPGQLRGPPAPGRAGADEVFWTTVPDFQGTDPSELPALRAGASSVTERTELALTRLGVSGYAATGLPDVLRGLQRQRLVTRSLLTITGTLLLVLVVTVLLLAARLLAERRSGEQALLRARGASSRQLLLPAALEAGALGLLAALPAPLLARAGYAAVTRAPAFVRAGVHRDPGLPAQAWLAAAGAAVLFAAVLLLPSLRRDGTFAEYEQGLSRPARRTALLRGGLDAGLAVLAAVGYWQLRTYRSPLAGGSGAGGDQLDPILVAGPGLCLLAGALLVLRLLPALGRVAERVAARGRGPTGALAGWQVGRRPARAAGSLLLVTLAIAVGAFGLSYQATWYRSQQDQAAFQAGVDARIVSGTRPVLAQGGAIAAVPGAGAVTPAVRRAGSLGGGRYGADDDGGVPITVLALDAARVGPSIRARDDVLGGPPASVLAPLARAPIAGVPLPAGSARLRVRVGLAGDPADPLRPRATVRLLLRDAAGVRAPIELGSVLSGEPARTVTAGLPAAGPPAAGLRVVGIAVEWSGDPTGDAPLDQIRTVRLTVDALRAGPAGAAPVPIPAGLAWSRPDDQQGVEPGAPTAGGGTLLREAVTLDGFALTGSIVASTAFLGAPPPAAVPVLVPRAVAGRLALRVGDTLPLRLGGPPVPAMVAGIVPHVPSAPADDAVLADLGTVADALAVVGDTDPLLDEWWAAVPADRAEAWAAAAATATGGIALTRVAVARELTESPLRVGAQSGLLLLVLAAAACVGVGLAVHASVAVRLRRLEFAQLRALGLPRRGLAAVVGTEYAVLAGLGVLAGTGLGVLLGLLVGPLVTLGAQGALPVPAVQVLVPWLPIGRLAAEVVLLAVVAIAGAVGLRRPWLGATLRLGEER
jgi:hypothetical protein